MTAAFHGMTRAMISANAVISDLKNRMTYRNRYDISLLRYQIRHGAIRSTQKRGRRSARHAPRYIHVCVNTGTYQCVHARTHNAWRDCVSVELLKKKRRNKTSTHCAIVTRDPREKVCLLTNVHQFNIHATSNIDTSDGEISADKTLLERSRKIRPSLFPLIAISSGTSYRR